jgi:hypothetical protein
VTANKPSLAHQTGDPLAATTNVVVIGKLRVNPRCPISGSGLGVDPFDHRRVSSIHNAALTRWPFTPRVVTLAGDPETFAHELD